VGRGGTLMRYSMCAAKSPAQPRNSGFQSPKKSGMRLYSSSCHTIYTGHIAYKEHLMLPA
jgi:hypothetical protein